MLSAKFILKYYRLMSLFMDYIVHWLLSPTCLLCGYQTQNFYNICIPCQQDLPILPQSCPKCARFISISSTICGSCLTNPPPFDRTYTLFPYEPPVIKLITQLKFLHHLEHAQALGELLTQAIQTTWYKHRPLPDIIIPIPLHNQRLRERGFNQALEIAKPISQCLAIPIDKKGVKRTKLTVAQSVLPAKARKENIANAFTVTRDYSNLSIALIDDVITTGHTIKECSRVLKEHGAKAIDVWCCARRG